jgi:trimethylamine:corrinoid methyltransferase-like protein
VIDEHRRELGEMGDERVAKRAVRVFEPAELEAIEPKAAAVLTDVGVDAADPQRAKRCR